MVKAKDAAKIAVFTLAAGLIGCEAQKPAITIDQARQIAPTISRERSATAPPPRSIVDIADLVGNNSAETPLVAEFRQRYEKLISEAPLPRNTDAKILVDFHLRRMEAYFLLGYLDRSLIEARTAYSVAQAIKTSLPSLYDHAANLLSQIERYAGDMRRAKELRIERMLNRPSLGRRLVIITSLVALEAEFGSLAEAKTYLAESERLYTTSLSWNDNNIWGNDRRAQLLYARSHVAIAEGRYADAEEMLLEEVRLRELDIERVSKTNTSIVNRLLYSSHRDYTMRKLTEVYIHQGRLLEAETIARKILTKKFRGGERQSATAAEALVTLAATLVEQGRLAEAEKITRYSLDTLLKTGLSGETRLMGWPTRILASSLLGQKRFDEAARIYTKMVADFSSDPWAMRSHVLGNHDIGLALIGSQRHAEAYDNLDKTYRDLRERLGEKHITTIEARGLRAVAIAKNGEAARARAEFDAVYLPLLAPQSDENRNLPALKDVRRKIIIEAYLAILTGGNAEDWERAFQIADTMKGHNVQRAIAEYSARAKSNDPFLTELIRREQDIRNKISAYSTLLTNQFALPAEQRDTGVVDGFQRDIEALRNERLDIRQQIERHFPDYANLTAPKMTNYQQARNALKPGESLIAIYAGEDQSYVWALPHTGQIAFARIKSNRAELAEKVRLLRVALDPQAATLGDIPDFDLTTAHTLFNLLLAPVRQGWANSNSLIIVPHEELSQLPFSLFLTDPAPPQTQPTILFAQYRDASWLMRKTAITQAPTVFSLTLLRGLPSGAQSRGRFIGFADPIFSDKNDEASYETIADLGPTRGIKLRRRNIPDTTKQSSADLSLLPPLPETAEEVRSVAASLGADTNLDVRIREQATEKSVKSGLVANRRVIMFATHGLIPGDLDGLSQPALALTQNDAADPEDDGLLTMEEVLNLKIDADWVVLSACNTAAGDGAGAEAISGLGRAFFYAGARTMLVSNWPVETTSARIFSTDLFSRQARNPGITGAEAARQAMAALIDGPGASNSNGQPLFSYAHPIFWAPFTVVGDGATVMTQ
ncbi:CHAT domain-containing protein [Ferrovibrio sp.]|uniref:CHAT domain-containing tetratricopeptide repeat protein n=1 Tax=Ferrovibrio sp. TaxID=1917215 RepID=UPI001B59C6CC|nr:CHAT domain-containing protein [Ferrovibrio sp.]MBP7065211.1 CHAT domain-containing protein [Ferrovibrio sp.]